MTAHVQLMIDNCKDAFAGNKLDVAYRLWCAIYDYFEDRPCEDLFEAMKNFTDDEVYGITDYGKKINGYA